MLYGINDENYALKFVSIFSPFFLINTTPFIVNYKQILIFLGSFN